MNDKLSTTEVKKPGLPVRPTNIATFRSIIENKRTAFAEVAPKFFSVDRLLKIAVLAAQRESKLLNCTTASLLVSLIQAAELGLEPGSSLGHAYLIPYKQTATLIIGYRGLIALARRSGEIESLSAQVVYSGDNFSCQFGTEPKIVHEPKLDGDAGAPIAVYAVARLKGGVIQAEVMTVSQIEAIRNSTPNGKGSTWTDHWDEMARKTVIRRLAKYLPLTIELSNAIQYDEMAARGERVPMNAGILDGVDGADEYIKEAEQANEPPAENPDEKIALVKRAAAALLAKPTVYKAALRECGFADDTKADAMTVDQLTLVLAAYEAPKEGAQK